MKKEPYTVGNYLHIFRRGNKGAPLSRESSDWWRFVLMLFYFNSDINIDYRHLPQEKISRGDTSGNLSYSDPFAWQLQWGERVCIVDVLCFTLMENHYHLLVKEICPGGISLFIKKVNTGMAMSFNKKYGETGSLFDRRCEYRVVREDEYFAYVSVYIQVKNVLERYPYGGIKGALQNWNKALEWALRDPYSSLADYAGERNSPIVEKGLLGEMFPTAEKYREFAKQCMFSVDWEAKLGELILE